MRVILLVGPSSAGKSTICDHLVEHHGWKAISLDEVALKLARESAPTIKPELVKHGIFDQLSLIMTEEEILTFSAQGNLNISRGVFCVSGHQFLNPTLPGLEQVLTEAGFDEPKIIELATVLRKAAQIGDEIPRPNPVDKLYDEVFSLENEDQTVVIDIVPPPKSVVPFLDGFHERAEKFRETYHDIALTTHTVLAYCPPQFLSGRIEERNKKAEALNDVGNMRVGVFPFQQLSTVLTAAPETDYGSPQHSITEDELFEIVRKHSSQSKEGALVIENPYDSSVLIDAQDEQYITEIAGDRVMLTNEDDFSQPIETELPKVGTVNQVQEYKDIRDQLGLHDYKSAVLSIRERGAYDAIIDTSKGDPAILAANLVSELESLAVPHTDLGMK